MTDYLILHHKNPTHRLDEEHKLDDGYLVSMSDYVHVAIVQNVNSLGEVFELTNHIDHDWTKNDRVTLFNKNATVNSIRSTVVGDMALNLETLELMICGPIGWEKAHWTS